jgi:hypothetical protein
MAIWLIPFDRLDFRTLGYPKNGAQLVHQFWGSNSDAVSQLLVREVILAEIDDPAKREELLQAMADGSAAAWGHLNLLGEYDFSEDKLQDSVGIKPPKLTD